MLAIVVVNAKEVVALAVQVVVAADAQVVVLVLAVMVVEVVALDNVPQHVQQIVKMTVVTLVLENAEADVEVNVLQHAKRNAKMIATPVAKILPRELVVVVQQNVFNIVQLPVSILVMTYATPLVR